MCEKKGTIKYSNKIDKFCQIAEFCEFEVIQVKMAFIVIGKIEFLCPFAIQDEVTGEKSSNLRGNYLRQRRFPKYGMLTNFS